MDPGERITLECATTNPKYLVMANNHFGKINPLLLGFVVTQAKLVIWFPIRKEDRGEVESCR